MELIRRFCACGCFKFWRCLSSSPNWFWDETHLNKALRNGTEWAKKKAQQQMEVKKKPNISGLNDFIQTLPDDKV